MTTLKDIKWTSASLPSPLLDTEVPAIIAKDIPYTPNAHRFQTLTLYLPSNPSTKTLIGQPVTSLPSRNPQSTLPEIQVHIHGGAWRDPNLTSTSIEAAAAHAFSSSDPARPLKAIVSMNYTLSPFPSHPTQPYDPAKVRTEGERDPSREAQHPRHVHDVYLAFNLLRRLGLRDGSYILSGHSCGACLVFQAILKGTGDYGLEEGVEGPPPRPAALLGLNGLYDLEMLVHGLGASHEGLKGVYEDLLGIAFGKDEKDWSGANPARFDAEVIAERVREGFVPRLVVLDQSEEDRLVPMNQVERLEGHLRMVEGMRVVRGKRCEGSHAAPWEKGIIIWESVMDVLKLSEEKS